MAKSGFKVGDRVKLRRSITIVRAGPLGTVQRVLFSIDAYDVQFDGHHGIQLAWGRDLERADEHERTTAGG
jgi:hypothetical protein